MLYNTEMSPIEHNIIKQAKRSGDPLPDRIKNRPKLREGLDLFIHAYHELDTERNLSMGPCPIPDSAVRTYNRDYEIAGEMGEDMLYFIRAMDNAFLKSISKK